MNRTYRVTYTATFRDSLDIEASSEAEAQEEGEKLARDNYSHAESVDLEEIWRIR
jgi:hypothetical protein